MGDNVRTGLARAERAATSRLLAAGTFLRRADTTPDLRAIYQIRDKVNDSPYRQRWAPRRRAAAP